MQALIKQFTIQVEKELDERKVGYAQGISIPCPNCQGEAYYQFHKFEGGLIEGKCFNGCFDYNLKRDGKIIPSFKRGVKPVKKAKGFIY